MTTMTTSIHKLTSASIWALIFLVVAVTAGCRSDDDDLAGLATEDCFFCHGDGYKGTITGSLYPDDIVALTLPAGYTSMSSMSFSPRTDAGIVANGDLVRLPGFSNKSLEFDSESPDTESVAMQMVDLARFGFVIFSHTRQTQNPAFHPVLGSGRNGSWQLCNQLAAKYQLDCGCGPGTTCPVETVNATASASALTELKIPCAGCHEARGFAVYRSALATDPHELDEARLLRGSYDTGTLMLGRCFSVSNPSTDCLSGDGFEASAPYQSNDSHFDRFLLCFQCHDRRSC